MAFLEKTDYFGLSGTALECTTSNDGASASVAEAKGADGSVVAHEVYGEALAPSCDYLLKADWTSAAGAVKLGSVKATGGKSVALASVAINTSAGSAPTVAASGEQVEDGATDGCLYEVPAFSLPKTHHAHILFGAFTLSGAGCHLTAANYTASAGITKATKEGAVLAHDVGEGKIEAVVTIVQTGAAAPSLAAGEGWSITSPLAMTNPDADYPTYSATLTHYLSVKE